MYRSISLGKNPNVAGVLVIAMGYGSILQSQIADEVAKTDKPVDTLTCQEAGGPRKSVALGIEKLKVMKKYIDGLKREEFPISRLVIGIKCGGSDTSSGIASNPSVGIAGSIKTNLIVVAIAAVAGVNIREVALKLEDAAHMEDIRNQTLIEEIRICQNKLMKH